MPYYYRKNLFGDIVEIYDDENQLAASYTYDAWGNCTFGANVDNIANVNPFRYRGYYYDWETRYYYLQTRYYDPQVGRFINADEINYLDPKSIQGCNLYAYCSNNPIMAVDPTGTFLGWLLLGAWLSGVIVHAVTLTVTYVAAAIASLWDADVKADMDHINWNPFNDDASKAASANKVSFYKGSAVVLQNLTPSSFAFGGIIWLKPYSSDITVKHEWGHTMQELILGEVLYTTNVAIPSVAFWLYTDNQSKAGNPKPSRNYYNTPWERVADMIGRVPFRGSPYVYKPSSDPWAIAEFILGPIVIPFYFLFEY